jgi:hypothetical protein
VLEARSINRAEILTARTGAAAEATEVTAAEAAAAEAAAAVEAAAAAGVAAKAAADAHGARAALAPELPKEPGGGAGDMAKDAEKTPGRPGPCLVWGPERNWKLEAGRLAVREQTRQSRPRDRHRSKFQSYLSTVMR